MATSSGAGSRWRETELRILRGIVHEMNGALGGITLAFELARMDDELPAETVAVLQEQASRLQREVDTLSSVIALEQTAVQLHDPLELAQAAVHLFSRMSAQSPAAVRIVATPRVVAVEVAAGACIRALVLCMRALDGSLPAGRDREMELHIDRFGSLIAAEVRAGNASARPQPDLIAAAGSLLTADSGARLEGTRLTMKLPA